jgi:hypothetical protein
MRQARREFLNRQVGSGPGPGLPRELDQDQLTERAGGGLRNGAGQASTEADGQRAPERGWSGQH